MGEDREARKGSEVPTKLLQKQRSARNLIEWLDVRDVLESVRRIAAAHHVTVEEILSRNSTRDVVRARRAVALHMSEGLGWSSTRIGEALDRNHSTVLAMLNGKRRAA